MTGPTVSVVIVTWNSAETLGPCLDSLQPLAGGTDATTGHSGRPNVDVTVIDNASADDTALIAAQRPWVRFVANDSNRGLAAANNQGISATHGDYVLIANPDVIFAESTIDALVACAERHPRAGFVFCRLHHPDGTLQTTVGSLPRLSEAVLGRQLTRARQRAETGMWWDAFPHDRETRVGHGLEACYLIRRSTIEDIGLQDEQFWLDWEGIDWCARGDAAGWECWFDPAASATHVGGGSLRQAPVRWILNTHRGMYHYFAKRYRTWARPLLLCLFAGRGLVKLAALPTGRTGYGRAHPGASPAARA